MPHPPERDAQSRTLHPYLSAPVREMQSEICGLFDVAASRRSTARRREEPILTWETRTRVHPLKGVLWEKSLKELTVSIAASCSVYRGIYEAESQALPLMSACLDSIRNHPAGDEAKIPEDVLRMFEISGGLRSDSLVAIERALAISSQIGAFSTRSTPQDVLSLLDDRRRAIAESEACRNRAEVLVRRAFRLETDRVEDMESAAVKALGALDEVPTPGTGMPLFGEAERDTWLRFLDDDISMTPPAKSRTAAPTTEEFLAISDKLPTPQITPEGDDEELNLAVARLRAAEARLSEATTARDRAIATVTRLSVRVTT